MMLSLTISSTDGLPNRLNASGLWLKRVRGLGLRVTSLGGLRVSIYGA